MEVNIMAVRIEKSSEDYLMVSFNYSYDKVSSIKEIEGARWNEGNKSWVIPNNRKAINEIALAFCDDDIIFDSSVELFDR
ncbi:integrase [Haloimpatiens sp. FM7315]|uniref:integrase n=1 Tax=Haloimpatiens sp. FM7315 TaxID=3298609 RepID=UPI0039777417